MPFEEVFIEIKNDDNIRELMTLYERFPHVDLFLEHTNADDEQDHVENFVEEHYEFGSDDDDEEEELKKV